MLYIFIPVLALLSIFKQLAAKKKIKGLPIDIVSFKNHNQITDVQLLYINRTREADIEKIVEKLRGKNILLITDRCSDQNLVMINFLEKSGEGKTSFEVVLPISGVLEEYLAQ